MLHIGLDFFRYIATCLTAVLAGFALIRLVARDFQMPLTWLLAPAMTQAVWAVTVGMTGALRIPMQYVAIPLALITVALAAYSVWRQWRMTWSEGALVALALALPVLVLLPFFAHGLADYPGSRLADGWSYAAYGEYLWAYPRGTEGGLAPLYQWASHASDTRHVSSSLLGLLSLETNPGNVQSASGLFLALSIFVFGSSCAAYAWSRERPLAECALILLVSTLSGWIVNVVFANNYDNLAALAAFPAAAAVITRVERGTIGPWILLALILTGLFYTFPELAVVVVAICGVMVIERMWRQPAARSLVGLVVAATIVLLLASPYLASAIRFVSNQTLSTAPGTVRPGEGYFPGLLAGRYQASAFWGLGGEFQAPYRRPQLVFGLLLFALLARGLVDLIRKREIGLLSVLALPLLGAPFLIVFSHYAYGAYKMILIGWWALTFVLVTGGSRRRYSWLVTVVLCLAIPFVATARTVRDDLRAPARGLERFREVLDAAPLANGSPIGIMVNDWEASEWAVLFLKDVPTRLGERDLYLAMPHVQTRLARATPFPWNDVRFVLTDAVDRGPVIEDQGWTAVWRNDAYTLWDTGDHNWAIAAAVQKTTPIDGGYGIDLTAGPAAATVVARRAGCLIVSATIDESASRREAGPSAYLTGWRVQPGENAVTIDPPESGTAPPSGRLVLKEISGRFPPTVSIERVQNQNGVEEVDGQPFFWAGGSPAIVRVASSAAADIVLRAIVELGPSLPDVDIRHLRVKVGSDPFRDVIVSRGPMDIPATVRAGETVISLEALDKPTRRTQSNGDPRPLLLGVRNLRVELASLPAACR